MKNIIIIPARLNSSRLPKKVLFDLEGKTVVQRVYEQCLKSKKVDEVFIAVDSQEVEESCKKFTHNVIMTGEYESGTDRIAEVAKNLNGKNIINVQGDEPFIQPELIDELFGELENGYEMVSAMHTIELIEDLKNPNIVKLTINNKNEAIYFSRSIIPHHRDEWDTLLNKHKTIPNGLKFYRHLGIYGYKKEFLIEYSNMKVSYLERLEKLEQLRVIENGYKIKMIETNTISIGIDTIGDYEKAKQIIKGEK